MSVSFGMILFGALLIYGGWTNRSVWALARGDNSQPKPSVPSGAAGQVRTAGAPSSSGTQAQTGTGGASQAASAAASGWTGNKAGKT